MRIRLVIFNNTCSFIYLFVIEHLLLNITRIWFIHVGTHNVIVIQTNVCLSKIFKGNNINVNLRQALLCFDSKESHSC